MWLSPFVSLAQRATENRGNHVLEQWVLESWRQARELEVKEGVVARCVPMGRQCPS